MSVKRNYQCTAMMMSLPRTGTRYAAVAVTDICKFTKRKHIRSLSVTAFIQGL